MVIAAIAASFLALFQCRRIAVAHFFDTVLRLMRPRFLFFESFLNPRPSPKYSYRPSGVISAAFLVSVSLAESLVVLFLAGRDVAPLASDVSSTSTFLFFRLVFFCFVIACENALLVSASVVVDNVAIVSEAVILNVSALVSFQQFPIGLCCTHRFPFRVSHFANP